MFEDERTNMNNTDVDNTDLNRKDVDNETAEGTETHNSNASHTDANSTGAAEHPYFDYTAASNDELNRKADTQRAETRGEMRKRQKLERKQNKVAHKAARRMGKRSFVGSMAVSLCIGLCFGAFAAVGFYGVQTGMNQLGLIPTQQKETETTPTTNSNVMPLPDKDQRAATSQQITYVQDDISQMVEQVMPSMVSIVNQYTSSSYDFWGQRVNRENQASGSGIIVGETDEALLVATNNHVVENATKLEVTFIDGEKAEAQIKGTDPDMDLAVIAVPLNKLEKSTRDAITVATLGDSDALKLGEPVVAIGNALGYGQSVTNGIVSALNREITSEDGNTNKFIQTNAAINPGNSGGALLNIKGEVIGINSSKIGGSSIEGMGYAIPISSASPILNDLMNRKIREKVEADEVGYMGITMQAITQEFADAYDWPRGVFIKEVAEDSAAEKAGLLHGDIIVKMDGQRVYDNNDLADIIQCFKAGDTVTVTIKRPSGGQFETKEIDVVLGKRPND